MTRLPTNATLALLLFTTAAACGLDDDPAYPENCTFDPAFQSTRSLDDATLLGFSGADVVALAAGMGAGSLTWQDGTTSTLTVEVTGGGTTAVFAPPPNQGYCKPDISVDDVHLRFRTTDTRLDVEVVTTLVGPGYDGALESVFPVFASIDVPQPNALQIPASWSSAQRTSERVGFNFHVAGTSPQSPYCHRGESLSSDANDACNIHDGVLMFSGSGPGGSAETPPPGSRFSAALGWWTRP